MTTQLSEFQYLAPEENSSLFSTNFYNQDPISVIHMTNFLSNIPEYSSSNPSSLSNNSSTSDVICERKRRRMISNRESARRSRVRKQKQLDELLSQLVGLRTDNQRLIEQMNHLVESHERGVEENARLKEESTDIRQRLDEIQLASISSDMLCPYLS